MPASESGGVITITGTEDISIVSTITGVDENTNRDVTVLDIGTLRLDIQGTVSHNPDTHVLICTYGGANPSITLSGTYTYGVETTANSNTRRSGGMGLIIQGGDTASQAEHQMNNYGGIYVNGGTLNMYGGVYLGDRGIGFYNSPTLAISGTKFVKVGTTSRREIRFDDEAVPSGSFAGIIDGFQISARELPTTFAPTIVNGELAQLAAKTAGTAITTLNLSNLDTSGSISTDADLLTDDHISSSGGGGDAIKFWHVTNASEGSLTRTMPKSGVGDDRQLGGSIIYKQIEFTVSDSAGSPIEGAKVHMVDTDNSYRKNANSQDHTADKTYSATTNVSGETGALNVITAITNIDTQGSGWAYSDWDTTNFSNRYKVDRRGNDDTGADIFTFKLIGYEYLIGVSNQALKGLNQLDADWTLFDDALITETTKATVDAYPITVSLVGSTLTITGDSATLQSLTAAQLYDAVKSYLVDNFAGETETIVTRVGTQIDARALNVVLDYITFTGSITTTGTVTLNNGSTVSAGIIDSNGDSFLSFTHAWEVYANESDRNASTNLLDSGTSSDNYRFNFSGGTTYYMWVAGTKQEVTPAAAGETAVDLSTAALLVGIDNSLGFIPQAVYLDVAAATNGNGSASNPYNSVGDAIDFAVANNISTIYVDGDANDIISLPKAATGLTFECTNNSVIMNINGQNVNESTFRNIVITGAFVVANSVTLERCYLTGVSGFRGIVQNCLLAGAMTITEGTTITGMCNASQDTSDTITISGNIKVTLCDLIGSLTIAGVTGTAEVEINSPSATITIDSSCTGGTITVRGAASITDNSAGTTVNDETISSGGGASAADIYTYFTNGSNEDAFKADVSSLATQASVDAIDTVVDAILVDTDTTIPALISALNDIAAGDVRTELATELAAVLESLKYHKADTVRDGTLTNATVTKYEEGTANVLKTWTENGGDADSNWSMTS